jgi:two-component system OmpR family response regulator
VRAAISNKQTILIIDDSEIVLEVTKGALEAAGYRVITHSRAAGSVALWLQESPDLVLLDVNLPTISGDTLALMFDKARPGRESVILLHSTLAPEVLQAKANTVGAHGYLQKSGDLFNLVRVVNRWLKRQRPIPADDAAGYSSGTLRVARRLEQEAYVPPESGVFVRAADVGVESPVPIVLFVANDMAVLSEYRRVVQTLELSTEFALSGAQALRKVQSGHPPDVVVCNAQLSDISGGELVRRLIEHNANWRKRVILLTRGSDAAPSNFTTLREPISARAIWDSVQGAIRHAPPVRDKEASQLR